MKTQGFSRLGQRIEAPPISWLMKLTLDNSRLVSLAAGFTDSESLPVRETRELLGEILGSSRTGKGALQYGSTAGDPTLRRLTAERLRKMDDEAGGGGRRLDDQSRVSDGYSPERVIITNGSQQLLYMATEALCDEGDIVLVEDPTYFVYLSIAQSQGVRCRGIRMEGDGIEVADLERVLEGLKHTGELKRVRMLYLVSYHQNPTGATSSLRKKEAALRLLRRYERAAGHPIYVVEDAAYRELRFAGDDVPSLLSAREAAARVIYAGTYSKPFATGARVGFAVLPEPLLTVVMRIKGNHDFGTSNLLQQLLARALSSCWYERHLSAIRRRYARKAAVMSRLIRRNLPRSAEWVQPSGGLYVWVRLPRSVNTGVNSKVFRSALSHEVLYVPGQLCYAEDPSRRKPSHEMRLSFGGATEANIRDGLRRLGVTLRGTMPRSVLDDGRRNPRRGKVDLSS